MIANGLVMSLVVHIIQLYGGCSDYLTLFLQCGWRSVRQMVDYHSLVLMLKILQDRKPIYIHSQVSTSFA